jgi:pimeloyl-ACP methyl ester carboxylesterase
MTTAELSPTSTTSPATSRFVHANGIDIHYRESGQGEPLVLLHGGVVSSNPIWKGSPVAYATFMDALASQFRVIEPDTRGAGKTVNPGHAPVPFTQLADDLVAFMDALGLDRPAIGGFSEGGITAAIAAIRNPDRVRALINDAAYDFFNPSAPSFTAMRQILGGRPDATTYNTEAVESMFNSSDQMRPMFELMKADHDTAQGPGYWKTYIAQCFDRCTSSPGFAFADFSKLTSPTLILVGDRDEFCTVEEGTLAYRNLPNGQLAILPATPHVLSGTKIQAYVDFLQTADN